MCKRGVVGIVREEKGLLGVRQEAMQSLGELGTRQLCGPPTPVLIASNQISIQLLFSEFEYLEFRSSLNSGLLI